MTIDDSPEIVSLRASRIFTVVLIMVLTGIFLLVSIRRSVRSRADGSSPPRR